MHKKNQVQHFVFGYGSLINRESRALTGLCGASYPVKVTGVKRYWSVAVEAAALTAVGIECVAEAYCNGVVFAVDEDQLPLFDEREQGYERLELDATCLSFYQDCPDPRSRYWAYFGQNSQYAWQSHYPIAQSYVDVILTGCLEISESFARDFVNTTHAWQPPLQDRLQPRYVRAMQHIPSIEKIDELLSGIEVKL